MCITLCIHSSAPYSVLNNLCRSNISVTTVKALSPAVDKIYYIKNIHRLLKHKERRDTRKSGGRDLDAFGAVLSIIMWTWFCTLVFVPVRPWQISPLKTKRRLLYLKTQSVPRCKHFSSRF